MARTGEQQYELGVQMHELGRQMHALGAQMHELGKRMNVLGEQQRDASLEAHRRIGRLLDDAIASGTAEKVD
jgi:hypothetical protein